MRNHLSGVVVGLGALILAGCVQTTASQPPSRAIDPQALMGRSPDHVVADLGEPEIRRREEPVQVWQYRSDGCVFDLYFDAESTAAAPVVVYYEARSRVDGAADASHCLRQILAQGAQPARG